MRFSKLSLVILAVFAIGTAGFGQDPVDELQDLIGAPGMAIDQLTQRGYTYDHTSKSADSSYSYWRNNETGQCVVARVFNGDVASIVTSDGDCTETAPVAADTEERRFKTVCGVVADGKTHRYRCEIADLSTEDGKRKSVLKMPDMEMTLHWHRENNLGVQIEGLETVQTSFTETEGQRQFDLRGKTYFYFSDRKAARKELQHLDD